MEISCCVGDGIVCDYATSIWSLGSADPTIPVSGSRAMIAAIQAAGGHPKYTEFAGEGHGVWSYVYSLNTSSLRVSGFFSWLFSQQRK